LFSPIHFPRTHTRRQSSRKAGNPQLIRPTRLLCFPSLRQEKTARMGHGASVSMGRINRG
jgi:hypothetical protein